MTNDQEQRTGPDGDVHPRRRERPAEPGAPAPADAAVPHPGQFPSNRDTVDHRALSAGQSVSVPLVEEQLDVTKRTVETGQVVVHVMPTVERQTLEVPLIEESVEVERVAVNRFVDAPVPVRTEGDVTIVPVFEEVLVVEKRLMLKEEIRLVRRKVATREKQTFDVRKEEARVLRSADGGTPVAKAGRSADGPAE